MPSSTASYTLRTASRSTATPCASHRKNPASVAILTQTPPSEPLKPSMGGRCPRSPECCPRWIGSTVRDQSESLSAIAGIRIKFDADNDPHKEHDFGSFAIDGEKFFQNRLLLAQDGGGGPEYSYYVI